jgi:hypothetical protein
MEQRPRVCALFKGVSERVTLRKPVVVRDGIERGNKSYYPPEHSAPVTAMY